MSLINPNNLTSESTKNELYNSYQIIKKLNFFDEQLKDNLLSNKKSVNKMQSENAYSINDSKKYCLTSSNLFNLNKTNIIPISNINTNTNTNTNSFNLIGNSLKDIIIKKNAKKSLSTQLKKIKKKFLSLNEKSLPKKSNIIIYNNFTKKHKAKNYYKEDMKNEKLFSNLTTSNTNNNRINTNNNQTKFKQLKFKVFQSINKNYVPMCPHFLEKTENINRKVLEYYSSDNFKNIFKIYKKNLHYKTNMETHPKINTYVDISKINKESSFTQKLNFDKLFNKEEKKIILLEPDYYFKNTYKDCFENINIIKSNKLVEKMNMEELKK